MRRVMTLLVFAWGLGSALPAAAQVDEPAESPSGELSDAQREAYLAHYRRGIELVDADQWSDALSEFQQARRLRENANVLSNIAIALAALGRHVEAIAALEQLRGLTDPAEHPAIDAGLERSRASLARLVLEVSPPNAQISIDGGSEATGARHELSLDPGRHRISARAAGHREEVVELELAPGQQAQQTIELETALATEAPRELPDVRPAQAPPLAGWALSGIGAGVTVGSVVLLVVGLTFRAEIEGRTEPAPWDDFAERHRSAPVLETVGGVGAGVGLALLGVGVALSVGGDESSVQARVGPGGLTVRGAF